MNQITVPVLDDPKGMRPSTGYAAELTASRLLADGRTARVAWLYDTQTHVHVIVWVPGEGAVGVVEHVPRFHAGRESETLLKALES